MLANEESLHKKDTYLVEMDPRWTKFLISLKDKGFFQVRASFKLEMLKLLTMALVLKKYLKDFVKDNTGKRMDSYQRKNRKWKITFVCSFLYGYVV